MSLDCPRRDDGPWRLRPPSCRPRCSSGSKRSRPRPPRLAEVAARLDKIETRLARPSARVEVREDQAQLEIKAFTTWCRKGWDGLGDIERRSSRPVASARQRARAGSWCPRPSCASCMKNLVEISPMRQVARVQQVSGTPVLLPKRVANLTRRLGGGDRTACR